MCAEVGQGAGDHVKICNRSTREIAAKPARSANFPVSSPAWSAIARNTVRNSDVRSRTPFSEAKEVAMNKDRVAGATKEAVGGIKEKAGKARGDTEMEVEGKAKKEEGKGQKAAGKAPAGAAQEAASLGELADAIGDGADGFDCTAGGVDQQCRLKDRGSAGLRRQ